MNDDQRRIAFDLLYAENAVPIYRFALRLCGNREDAEDLAAEALAKAYEKWTDYRGDSSPRTWLCAIVLNQWRARKRKGSVESERMDDIHEIASTFQFPNHHLAEAVCSLSEPLREAFLLVKGEGFTHQEAAHVVRVPVGTMYRRVFCAVRELRQKLGSSPVEGQSESEVTCNHEL